LIQLIEDDINYSSAARLLCYCSGRPFVPLRTTRRRAGARLSTRLERIHATNLQPQRRNRLNCAPHVQVESGASPCWLQRDTVAETTRGHSKQHVGPRWPTR